MNFYVFIIMSYCGDLLLVYLHLFGFGLFLVVTILLAQAPQNNSCYCVERGVSFGRTVDFGRTHYI